MNRLIALSSRALAAALVLTALSTATQALAQVAVVDSHGREWRQLTGTTFRTWHEVAAVCPTDGVTPCAGLLGTLALDGWTWATREQVLELFVDWVPDVALTGQVSAPAYVLPAMGFFGSFTPTWDFYTTFGGYNYGSGWTATASDGLAIAPQASASWPVFNGLFDATSAVPQDEVSAYRGAWLFRPSAFVDLGHALAGTWGEARLAGTGAPEAGNVVTLTVTGGLPGAPAFLVAGASALQLPLLGGTLVPSPDAVLGPLTLDAIGGLWLTPTWPAGIPAGASLFLQAWFVDPAAPEGVAATNALEATAR